LEKQTSEQLIPQSHHHHWSQQQNATINHSSNDITGYNIIGGSTSMSSASDSSASLETAFRRVIEGGPDKEDKVIIVDKKTSCEAQKVLIENCNRLLALYTLCIGLETMADDRATKSHSWTLMIPLSRI
jgi:hypothetical protein